MMPNPVMHIEVPYEGGPLELEPRSDSRHFTECLEWLRDQATVEELPRILTSAVLLWHKYEGKAFIGACLSTAIVWERG